MKMTKRVFCVLMATLMALSALALSASAATDGKVTAGSLNVGDTFKYGMYPQSVVDDMVILDKLAAISDLDKNGYQDDGKVTLDGVQYYIYNVKDPEIKANEAITKELNGYKGFSKVYNYDVNLPYAFRMEPITWRVLEKNGNGVLLMAEDVLDGQAFNENMTNADGNEFNTSTIAKWLNEPAETWDTTTKGKGPHKDQSGFLGIAFTEDEQKMLKPFGYLEAQVNPVTGTKGGEVEGKRVILPSFDEITNKAYGFNKNCTAYTDGGYVEKDGRIVYSGVAMSAGYYERDEARRAVATDFAKAHGVWSNLPEVDKGGSETDPTYKPDPGLEYPDDPCYDNCRYWLRTPGLKSNFAAGVLEDGRVSTGWYTGMWIMGVRPMIRVELETEETEVKETAGLQISINKKNPYYKQKGVKVSANVSDVTWESTNINVLSVDADGNLNIVGTGTATIVCYAGRNTTTMEVKISYSWWQNFIRFVIKGWVKYL